MVRVGTHYLEPRRIAFFVVEEALLWAAFVLTAGTVAQLTSTTGAVEPKTEWLLHGLWVTAVVELGMYFADLHDMKTALGDAGAGVRLLRALGAAVIVVSFAIALKLTGERATALVAGLGATAVTALALRSGLPSIGDKVGLKTRIFLVGDGRAARHAVREIGREGSAEVVGFAGPRSSGIPDRARASGAEVIVVATDDRRGLPTADLLACRTAGLQVVDVATLSQRVLHRLPVELVRPSDLIYSDGFEQPLVLRAARRLVSLAAAGLLLLIAWPVMAVTALLVRLDSPGPILFRQKRVGKNGQPFEMLKFRTMRTDAEKMGAKWAQKSDPRVTRVGKHLRRYRIDELPQLWNVVRGDMELVGPRPERPEFVADLKKKIPYYDLRHLVRPGITGYAQVCYPYAATVEESKEKLQYDLYYVRHLSLGLDVLILAQTAKVVLFGKGAR